MRALIVVLGVAFSGCGDGDGDIQYNACVKTCGDADKIEQFCTDCTVGGMKFTSWCSCKQ